MLCTCSEKVKAGKWWELENTLLAYLVLNCTCFSLSTALYSMEPCVFWPLPTLWVVYVAYWLWKLHMLLNYAYDVDFEICSFDKKLNLCIWFWTMQFILKNAVLTKNEFVHILTCAFIFVNKIHPFLWTGRNPVMCKQG